MELLYYVVTPSRGTCEAVVKYPLADPIQPDRTDTGTVTLDQATDLAGKPDYTDQDVAAAVEAKAKLAPGTVAVPVAVVPAPAPVVLAALAAP